MRLISKLNRGLHSKAPLKLIWANKLVKTTSSQNRKSPKGEPNPVDAPEAKDLNKPNDAGEINKSGARSYLDVEQIVTAVVALILGVLGTSFAAFWFMSSENWESRLVRKVEESDTLATKIAEKVEQSKALPAAIVAQLRNTDEFKSVKAAVDGLRKLDTREGVIEGKISILEKTPMFRTKAVALGIQDPDFQTIALYPHAIYSAQITHGREFLQISYKILSVQGDIVVVELNALDSRRRRVAGVEFSFRAVPDKPVRLPFKFAGFPAVLLAILERPTSDTAVIAIGWSSSLPG